MDELLQTHDEASLYANINNVCYLFFGDFIRLNRFIDSHAMPFMLCYTVSRWNCHYFYECGSNTYGNFGLIKKHCASKYPPCSVEGSAAGSPYPGLTRRLRDTARQGSIMPVISSSLPEERIIFLSAAIDSDIRNAGDWDQKVDRALGCSAGWFHTARSRRAENVEQTTECRWQERLAVRSHMSRFSSKKEKKNKTSGP